MPIEAKSRPGRHTVSLSDLRRATLMNLGEAHPLSRVLSRLPDEIPAQEFRAKIADWIVLLEA